MHTKRCIFCPSRTSTYDADGLYLHEITAHQSLRQALAAHPGARIVGLKWATPAW